MCNCTFNKDANKKGEIKSNDAFIENNALGINEGESLETEYWLKFQCFHMGQINFFEMGGVDLMACLGSSAESMIYNIIRILDDKGNGNCGRSDIYGVELGFGLIENTLENLKKLDDEWSIQLAKGWEKRIHEGRPVSTGGYLLRLLYIDDKGWFTEEERIRISKELVGVLLKEYFSYVDRQLKE